MVSLPTLSHHDRELRKLAVLSACDRAESLLLVFVLDC